MMDSQNNTLIELLLEQRKMNMNQQQQINNQQAQIDELRKQTEFLLNGYYTHRIFSSQQMPENVVPLQVSNDK
jgi:hypothetical protein